MVFYMSLLIGLLAGFFGGLVGLGGGVIMIPLLVRFYKFSQHQAHGTSLMALVFTGLCRRRHLLPERLGGLSGRGPPDCRRYGHRPLRSALRPRPAGVAA